MPVYELISFLPLFDVMNLLQWEKCIDPVNFCKILNIDTLDEFF
jgi:hypothetical protein